MICENHEGLLVCGEREVEIASMPEHSASRLVVVNGPGAFGRG